MTKFVCKNSNNLLGFALLDQGIIDDNVFFPWHTEEISITVSTSLATINDMEFGQWKLQSLRKILNTSFQVARFEGRKLVEQRQNRDRVDGDHKYLQTSSKQPKIIEELVSSLLNNGQETSKNGWGKNKGQHLRLQHIHHKQLRCLLVKAKLLFQNEGMVYRSRQREDLLNDYEGKDEYD